MDWKSIDEKLIKRDELSS